MHTKHLPITKPVEHQEPTDTYFQPFLTPTPHLDAVLEKHDSPMLAMILDAQGSVQAVVELGGPMTEPLSEHEWALLANMAIEYAPCCGRPFWRACDAQYAFMAEILGVDLDSFRR